MLKARFILSGYIFKKIDMCKIIISYTILNTLNVDQKHIFAVIDRCGKNVSFSNAPLAC